MTLTESFAMLPAAAVAGFYLAHPGGALLRRRQDRRTTSSRTTRGAAVSTSGERTPAARPEPLVPCYSSS